MPSSVIPKTLHWCWFGGSEPPKTVFDNIAVWHALMPDYEILQWDESNFDVEQCAFCRGAYSAKKWAFVSDYARFKIVHEHGGVYMDVGSRLVKSIDSLLHDGAFTAREFETKFANPGLVLAAGVGDDVLGQVINDYERLEFKDDFKFLGEHSVNWMICRVLFKYGYTNDNDEIWHGHGFTVYPSEYFSPQLGFGGFRITDNTYATHLGSASWAPPYERFRVNFINKWTPYVGDFIARKSARLLSMALYKGDI